MPEPAAPDSSRRIESLSGFPVAATLWRLPRHCKWAGRALGIEALLVHVDHQLRKTSGEEAKRAEVLADALEMKFRAVTVATPPIAVHPGVGVEEAARRERYHILFETAIQNGARAVATAHHQRDQAETVLLHLLRGGGVHGAAGMAERAAAPFQDRSGVNNISRERNVRQMPRPGSGDHC